MEEFKEGDVVVLKSGSDKMTVYGTNDETVFLTWYINNEFKTYKLKRSLLKKV